MLRQETRHDHAHSVMHVSCFIQLSHARIYHVISCFSIAPSLEFFWIIPPDYIVIRWLEIIRRRFRELIENHHVEVTPYQLIQVGIIQPFCSSHKTANWNCTESQMHAHPCCSFDRRDVSRFVIVLHDLLIQFNRREGNSSFLKAYLRQTRCVFDIICATSTEILEIIPFNDLRWCCRIIRSLQYP